MFFPTPAAPIGEFVTVGGRRVHLRRDGDPAAPAIVLVHGFAGSLRWYDRVAAQLADRFHVLRLDLRGHGFSGGDTDLDAPAQGRTLALVLSELGLREVTLIGHSFGADVALSAAEQFPGTTAVGIIDQAPDYSYATFPPGNGLLAHPVLGPMLHRLSLPAFTRLGLRLAVAPGFDLAVAFDDPNQPVVDHHMTSPDMARVVIADRRIRLAANPLDAQLRALGLPALVLHGDSDSMYDTARTEQRYRDAGAEFHVVAGAGHSPNVERPTEVAQLLAEFVTAQRVSPA
ncbi:alpha/beta fold hydrolase [Nocardia stercoris]|uniref:Alpha/beta hydrolase n=1 Tax=Nocardia stercoris TaxID=2483361 RepID=A0A3M2KTL4_9NOCA|nr:alpha/beta hydrolase [Nocardia stercoris]RMI28284.1 alpha/beta hydrolase [Nocardia stercoris]